MIKCESAKTDASLGYKIAAFQGRASVSSRCRAHVDNEFLWRPHRDASRGSVQLVIHSASQNQKIRNGLRRMAYYWNDIFRVAYREDLGSYHTRVQKAGIFSGAKRGCLFGSPALS